MGKTAVENLLKEASYKNQSRPPSIIERIEKETLNSVVLDMKLALKGWRDSFKSRA